MLPVYQSAERSLLAAKAVMRDRALRVRKIGGAGAQRWLHTRDTSRLMRICEKFENDLGGCQDNRQLLGVEGVFSKRCYAEFARMAGLAGNGFRREAGVGKARTEADMADPVKSANRLIDHGNYLCYGMAGAALWALGVPPHMSVLHGKTRAGGLVFDLADGFKDALVLPLAFSGAARKRDTDPERTFRARLINAFDDRKILAEAVGTVERMIAAGAWKGSYGA